ncbi:hypothetical protein ACFQU2_30115 [Siccirubricoccus deserti]
MAALLVGFIGVLVVIRPGTEVFHWASLFVLLSATSYAVYQIMTRHVAAVDSPETSAIWSSAIGAFGMLLVIPFVWKTPTAWRTSRCSPAWGCWGRSATTAWHGH